MDNDRQITQNDSNKVFPEKSERIISNVRPKKALTALSLFLIIVIIIGVSLSAQQNKNRQVKKNSNLNTISAISPFIDNGNSLPNISPSMATLNTPISSRSGKLKFTADAVTGTMNTYLLSYFDTASKTLIHQRTINLSSLGWSVTLPETGSIVYNAVDDKIIIPLVSAPLGEGGTNNNTLPLPPFSTSVFTTSFSENTLSKLFSTSDFETSFALLNPKKNEILLNDSRSNPNKEKLWALSLTDGSLRFITTVSAYPYSNEKGPISFQDLQFTPNYNFANQQIQYSDNNRIETVTIDLNSGNVSKLNP